MIGEGKIEYVLRWSVKKKDTIISWFGVGGGELEHVMIRWSVSKQEIGRPREHILDSLTSGHLYEMWLTKYKVGHCGQTCQPLSYGWRRRMMTFGSIATSSYQIPQLPVEKPPQLLLC